MRHMKWLLLAVAALAALIAPASAGAALQTINGSPVNVYLADSSQMQAIFDEPVFGSTDGFFYSGTTGSSGFAVRFADGPAADETVGHVGDRSFATISNGPVSGTGSTADPLTNVTVYEARSSTGAGLLRITQTARYINGQNRFRMTYQVENIHTEALRFRAMTGGDLYVDGDDSGVGVFIASSPRFVGGSNTASRITGGVEEILSSRLPSDAAPVPVAPWAGYEVNGYSTTYARWREAAGFTDFIHTERMDNGVGIEWEDRFGEGQGLAPGAQARYEALWKIRQPLPLTLSPPAAAPEVGAVHRIYATLRDTNDQPVNGTLIRWDITGAHPQTGSAATSGQGQVVIEYTGVNEGVDTITAYADENGNGVRDSEEPTQTVTARWRPETEVDPPTVEEVRTPSGDLVAINVQQSTDDPVQRWFSIPNSQAGQFEQCPNGEGARMNLPINVPISSGTGTVQGGSVQLLLTDPVSNDPSRPIRTIDYGSTVPGDAMYRFVIECVLRSNMWVRYILEEGGDSQEFIVPIGGLVLIDPQGVVYDADAYDAAVARGLSPDAARAAAAIRGATVRLQREVQGEFRNVLSGDPGIAPNVNPQITGTDGRYQWDVSEGRYRVVVAATGYPTVTSSAVDIPPPVLDLHIAMRRPGGSTGDDAASSQSVAGSAPPLSGPVTVVRTRSVTFRLRQRALVNGERQTLVGTATCRRTTGACTNVLARLMAVSTQRLGGTRASAAQRPRLTQLTKRALRIAAGRTVAIRLRVGPKAYRTVRTAKRLRAVVAVRERASGGEPDQTARIELRRP